MRQILGFRLFLFLEAVAKNMQFTPTALMKQTRVQQSPARVTQLRYQSARRKRRRLSHAELYSPRAAANT
jgi:hypothetical protein